ncbi:MAG: helix-turn-helix domain-containing protein [Eubacteriales bacterium]|nr:helix-turn-helix domain-containing protein [Eubacteriales bacterium]
MHEELLTVKEVAAVLRSNSGYVYRLRDAGLLKFMKLGNLKCRRSTLDAFIRSMDGMDVTDPMNIKPLEEERTSR